MTYYIMKRDWPDEDFQVVWFMPTNAGGAMRAEKEFDTRAAAEKWAAKNLTGAELSAHA